MHKIALPFLTLMVANYCFAGDVSPQFFPVPSQTALNAGGVVERRAVKPHFGTANNSVAESASLRMRVQQASLLSTSKKWDPTWLNERVKSQKKSIPFQEALLILTPEVLKISISEGVSQNVSVRWSAGTLSSALDEISKAANVKYSITPSGYLVVEPLSPATSLARFAPASVVTYEEPVRVAYFTQPTAVAVQAPKATVNAGGAMNDRLISFINQAVMSGKMDASVAVSLIRSLLDSESASAPSGVQYNKQGIAAAPVPAPAPLPATALATAPAPAPLSRWTLDTKLTLKDNIDAWSKSAGWHPSQWDASNFFQITSSSTVVGDFPGVLRQIADSTGLNICAITVEKTIRVTDASVSCK